MSYYDNTLIDNYSAHYTDIQKQHTSPAKKKKQNQKGRYYTYNKQKIIILINTN
jgi:hypothetical protein